MQRSSQKTECNLFILITLDSSSSQTIYVPLLGGVGRTLLRKRGRSSQAYPVLIGNTNTIELIRSAAGFLAMLSFTVKLLVIFKCNFAYEQDSGVSWDSKPRSFAWSPDYHLRIWELGLYFPLSPKFDWQLYIQNRPHPLLRLAEANRHNFLLLSF